MSDAKFARQLLAFGADGQQAISAQHVSIVGVGGLGSQVAQALAYLGVRRFSFIDDDKVEETNLNRLIGGNYKDIGKSKVEIVTHLVKSIDTSVECSPIPFNLRSRQALETLQQSTTVFGCVDNDGARLVLTEFSCAYRKTYIDLASEIIPDSAGKHVADFGGRVVVALPGKFCLACAGEIDMEAAKASLEPEQARALRVAHGYGLGPDMPTPSVVSLNGIIANLAVTEYLAFITGIREPFCKTTYKGMRGIVQVSKDVKRENCINCDYMVGQGDKLNVFRYATA